MGRAIDMEKDIDSLKLRVDKLEKIVRGMTHRMDEVSENMEEISEDMGDMSDKATKTKHIDLVDDVKTEEEVNGKEEKANDEGSNTSSGSDNKPSRNTKKKTSKHGSDS